MHQCFVHCLLYSKVTGETLLTYQVLAGLRVNVIMTMEKSTASKPFESW